MHIQRKKLLLFALVSTVVGILNILLFKHPIVGSVAFFVYLVSIGIWIGYTYIQTPQHQFFWGITSFFFFLSLLTTVCYYLFGITPVLSSILLVLPLVLFIKKSAHNTPFHSPRFQSLLTNASGDWWTIGAGIIQAVLLYTLIQHRTTDILVSPWQTLGPLFFITYLFGLVTTGFAAYKTHSHTARFLITSCALFNTYAVAAILYTYGFGFDGFIHRATETWIQNHGFIDPKTPFYIGQHSMIVWVSFVTGIRIFLLDIYYVPLLSALILPPLVSSTLRYTWNIPEHKGVHLVWIIPCLYFITLNLTTPHNLALLLSIIVIFTTFGSFSRHLPISIPILFALVTCAVHPLVGAPMVVFVLTAWLLQTSKKRWQHIMLLIGSTLGLTVLPTLMFAIHNYLGGHGLPQLTNPLASFEQFFILFERPYWYATQAPLLFELLYQYQWCIGPIVIFLAIYGFILRTRSLKTVLFPLAFISFIAGAWMLRTWITFPNLTSAEATNYPLRLIWASVLFLLPWSMYGLYDITHIWKNMLVKKKQWQYNMIMTSSLVFLAGIITVSFYFSYPQRNQKVHFPGFNVTKADVHAVKWIHDRHDSYEYIVLSNPLVGVTALTEYSFAKYHNTDAGEVFYYSIPSGGPLYPYYLDMVYKGQSEETMQNAMTFTDTDTAYFVINSYWKNYHDIVEGAKKTADEWHVIEDDVTIFMYTK